MIYEVDMDQLVPGQKYLYRVGGYDSANSTLRYSSEFDFVAAPSTSDPNRRTTVATLGTF